MRRRLRLTILIIASQILLIALAFSWLIHMVIIASEGSVYFVENDPAILWGEISVCIVINIFALYVLIIQIRRLGERRENDRNVDRRNQ